MNKINIEITGVNFINKGAELMLHAIVQEFNDSRKYRLITDITTGSFLQRSKLGLYQKFRINPLGYHSKEDEEIALKNIKRDQEIFDKFFKNDLFAKELGLISPKEIDVVLDASGFRYSSQWGEFPTERQAFLYKQWYKEGKKIILLPQAFGPFDNDKIVDSFINIIKHVHLVFARDKISYEHILSICPNEYYNKVMIFPDFTCFVKGELSSEYLQYKQKVCIIPNSRMKDKTTQNIYKWYMDVLKKIINYLSDKNMPFFFLILDNDDINLMNELEKSLKTNFPIVQETNAIKIKGIISQSSHVISSRFHGLVSALTSGVPSIGIGWSHKYKELFRDFDSTSFMIENGSTDKEVMNSLNRLFDEKIYNSYKNILNKNSNIYMNKTKQMWNIVKDLINE